MSKVRYTKMVVLCEDRQHEVFARHFLSHYYHLENHQLRFVTAPKGKGAAEQYVREQFGAEVRSYRHIGRLNIALVVIVDADNFDPEDRLKQFNQYLQVQDIDPLQAHEAIAIFVPKRNIETWIAYLGGETVNERDDWPHLTGHESDCIPDVKTLADDCRNNRPLPKDAPLSLKNACETLQRIPRKA